jgi:hypothetical protein
MLKGVRVDVIDPLPEQVGALSDLAAWTVGKPVDALEIALQDIFTAGGPHCTSF